MDNDRKIVFNIYRSQNKYRVQFYHLSLAIELALKMKDNIKLGSSTHITLVQAFNLQHNYLCVYICTIELEYIVVLERKLHINKS